MANQDEFPTKILLKVIIAAIILAIPLILINTFVCVKILHFNELVFPISLACAVSISDWLFNRNKENDKEDKEDKDG